METASRAREREQGRRKSESTTADDRAGSVVMLKISRFDIVSLLVRNGKYPYAMTNLDRMYESLEGKGEGS